MRLLLIRHGHTAAIVAENPDPPLTGQGEQQAAKLGAWLLERYSANRLFTSPLRRAYQTATIIGAYVGIQPEVEHGLSEADFGMAAHLPQGTIFSPQMQKVEQRSSGAFYREYQDLVKRSLEHIMFSCKQHDTILVVAHAGTIGTALRCLLESQIISVRTDFTAQHELIWRSGRWFVLAMNRREHLLE